MSQLGAIFTVTDLRAARDAGALNDDAYGRLVEFLKARDLATAPRAQLAPVASRFDLTHVLWYAGALIVIVAMGLFSNEAFNRMGGWALTTTAAIYVCVFLMSGHYLWHKKGLTTPGGLAIAIAVSLVPLAIYGIQDALDLWRFSLGRPGEYKDFFPEINGSWLYMEFATIIAAIIAIRFYPFAFIAMIAAVALWFMSMDLAPWVARGTGDTFELRRTVSLWFGLLVMVAAWAIDLRRDQQADFAFWLHLFGVMAFWGGLTAHDGSSELQKAAYCLINIGLVLLAVFLKRRIYAVFGAIGVVLYLGYLAHNVFKDDFVFSFALSVLGVAVIGLGLLYHRRQRAINVWIDASLPPALRALRPVRARDRALPATAASFRRYPRIEDRA